MSSNPDDNFLSRWSRRKVAAKRGQGDDTFSGPQSGQEVPDAASAGVDRSASTLGAPSPANDPPLTDDDFKDVDFDALTYSSDYGRFLQKGVPETIRQKALAKLWSSDPMFTAVDQFQDYAGDFTDAAMAVPGGALQSAYRVGQGFLTDDEAKAWDDLGKPDAAPSAAALAAPGGVALRPLHADYGVRPAVPSDIADISSVATLALGGVFTKLHGAAFARGMAQLASHEALSRAMDDGLVLDVAVQKESGKIVGFCGGKDRDITWHAVWPDHGRKGLGLALLRYVEARLGPGDLGPNVLASRVSAGLLQRLGYHPIAEQVVDTPGGVSATLVVMRRG